MRLFDTHAHMQDERYIQGIEEYIDRAERAGVKKILSCGVHEGDWEELRRISKKYNCIIPAYGLHPWFVNSRSVNWLAVLEKYLENDKVFVGEIGLDRVIPNHNIGEQVDVFIRQLRLAEKLKKPLSIHCRKAWGVLAEVLKGEGGLPYGGVIHSFSGSSDMVKVLEKMGAYISFSGSVTKSANKRVVKAAKAVSAERLLIETDSPDILPAGCNRTLNEPANLTLVVQSLSKIRDEDISYIAMKTYENAMRLFGD